MPIHICSINSFYILMEYEELEQIRQKTKKTVIICGVVKYWESRGSWR